MYLIDREGIQKIIPHRQPMLLIDGLMECDTSRYTGSCGLTVGENYNVALEKDSSLPAFALIEVMAQAAAAIIYYSILGNNLQPPDKGLLLSVRNFKYMRKASVPKGTFLIAHATVEYSDDKYKQVSAYVTMNNEIISETRLSLFAPLPTTLKENS